MRLESNQHSCALQAPPFTSSVRIRWKEEQSALTARAVTEDFHLPPQHPGATRHCSLRQSSGHGLNRASHSSFQCRPFESNEVLSGFNRALNHQTSSDGSNVLPNLPQLDGANVLHADPVFDRERTLRHATARAANFQNIGFCQPRVRRVFTLELFGVGLALMTVVAACAAFLEFHGTPS